MYMQQASAEILHSKPAANVDGQIYICDEQCIFIFNSNTSNNIAIKNQDDILTITGDSIKKNTIDFISEDFCPNNSSFMLHEILVNGPSRHTLFGKRFDIELELVYISNDSKEMVAVSVFGKLLEGKRTQPENSLLTQIANSCFPQHLKTSSSNISWNVNDILPTTRTFFTYNRSSKVKNIVMETPIIVPLSFIKLFKKYVVTPSAYKTAMEAKPTAQPQNLVIYATVSPPVTYPPSENINSKVNKTKENFNNAMSAMSTTTNEEIEENGANEVVFIEHMENSTPNDPPHPSLEQLESQDAGFSALFALGWYLLCIVLWIIVTRYFWTDFWTPLYTNLYKTFSENPEYAAVFVIPLVIVILLSIPIESSVKNGAGKTAAYFFIYLCLTVLMIICTWIYATIFNINKNGDPLIKYKDSWYNFCDPANDIGVAVPATDIGVAVPATDIGVAVPATDIGVAVPPMT